MIAVGLRRRQQALDLAHHLASPARQVVGHVVEYEKAGENRIPLQPRRPLAACDLDRFVEVHLRPGKLPALHEGLAEQRKQRGPALVLGGKEDNSATEEVGSGRHVSPGEGASPGGGQARGGAPAEVAAVLVEGAELREVAVGLLEVVRENLFEL